MLCNYFIQKVNEEQFDIEIEDLAEELKDKKILVYGAGEEFELLDKKYNLDSLFNIVALTDKKFEHKCSFKITPDKKNSKFKTIPPTKIKEQDYDTILVTCVNAQSIFSYLENDLEIKDKIIKQIFNKNLQDICVTYDYLQKFSFDKNLKKLSAKLKGKSVLIYGIGIFFEVIKNNYDISGLNIVAISDRRFSIHEEDEKCFGYKVCSPEEICDLNPDFVLVSTKFYVNIIEDLYYNTLKGTNIKIKPLIKKPFLTLVKEIWG